MRNWRRVWDQYYTWIGLVIAAGLIMACYGFALRLPFFFDDLPIMGWAGRHSLLDIWTRADENAYYRPLTFTVYKLGLALPMGMRQIVLHSVNPLLHLCSAMLILLIVKLCDQDSKRAVLASTLFAVFPFMFRAIPWITTLPHLLVTCLTLLAVYAALRAERDNVARWWGISLLAMALAPLAHESGAVCSAIVAGVVIIQHGLRSRRRIAVILLGGLFNVAVVLVRSHLPRVGAVQLVGWRDLFQNSMFFVHGLLYPVAPIIGWLVHKQGWHDLTLVEIAAAALLVVLVWLVRRSRDWRWIARSLWWWGCASAPAALAFRFDGLFIAPRFHSLGSPATVMLWAGIIIKVGQMVRPQMGRTIWGRRLVWGLLAGAILIQNMAFLNRERDLHLMLDHLYQQVMEAGANKNNAPIGFINVPAWLAWRTMTYALVTEGVLFVPGYSNITEFIAMNEQRLKADSVMFGPLLQDDARIWFGFQGDFLEWEQMRQYAIDHRTVWLSRYKNGQFELDQVGAIETGQPPSTGKPLVRFEGGPVIESASAQREQDRDWMVTLTWWAPGPTQGGIFVHVRDAEGKLVAQADGPALGGTVPIWLWQSGDRIYDIRHISLPEGKGPFTVQVGVSNDQGRLPAFVDSGRCLDDAAPVIAITP